MLISKAFAQDTIQPVTFDPDVITATAEAPSAIQMFMTNMGLVGLLVLMFYVLLIRPQQKRMREHTHMLQGLKKGDRVMTSGGLIGKITKIHEGHDEVEVELAPGTIVTVVRSMLQGKDDPLLPKTKKVEPVLKDKPEVKKAAPKKVTAKKTPPKKTDKK